MKDTKGFEGLYAVTSCGRIWSYKRSRFLQTTPNRQGYLYVHLYKDGKSYHKRVHRLIAEAYIPNLNNLPEVNHKDEIKDHNWINNLEWCTKEYNIRYGTGIERANEKRIRCKIRCVETGEVFNSITECSKTIGYQASHIIEHLNGNKSRKHILGMHFERIDK